MQQFCMYGSVRGALGNWRPYRDRRLLALVAVRKRNESN